MILALQACAPNLRLIIEGSDIQRAKNAIAVKDFKAAGQALNRALENDPLVHEGEALFLLALMCAHPDNPEGNTDLAESYLQSLKAEYPGTTLQVEADMLLALLAEHRHARARAARMADDLQKTLNRLTTAEQLRKETLRDLVHATQQYEDSLTKLAHEIQLKNNAVEAHEQVVGKLKRAEEQARQAEEELRQAAEIIYSLGNQIDQFKQVDLKLEKEKRKSLSGSEKPAPAEKEAK